MVRNRTILRSRGHVTTSGDVFGCHTGGVPLASEAGTPLSTLQYTGQRPLQSCLTQTANGVEAENPCSKRMKSVRVRVCVCVKEQDTWIGCPAGLYGVSKHLRGDGVGATLGLAALESELLRGLTSLISHFVSSGRQTPACKAHEQSPKPARWRSQHT